MASGSVLDPELAYDAASAPITNKDNDKDKKHFSRAVNSVEGGHSNITNHAPSERGPPTHEFERKQGAGAFNWGRIDDPLQPLDTVVPAEKHLEPTSDAEEKAALQAAAHNDSKIFTLEEYEKKHGPV